MIKPAHLKSANRLTNSTSDVLPLGDSARPDDKDLAANISQRIRARLPGRVRCLAVLVTETGVTLAGQCSTYYSKQMAQQVAMGVLDYQRLVNNIDVEAGR